MELQAFLKEYKAKIKPFEIATKHLDKILKSYMEKYQLKDQDMPSESRFFRVRLHEGRVKEANSLFRKIQSDKNLDFNNVFLPGHVRDLIGVRIVCHNLRDVEKIAELIVTAKWGELNHVGPYEPKKWLKESNPESGYRGEHIDVRWKFNDKGKYYHAEIQIRTLLQDAWATFMHDDISVVSRLNFANVN